MGQKPKSPEVGPVGHRLSLPSLHDKSHLITQLMSTPVIAQSLTFHISTRERERERLAALDVMIICRTCPEINRTASL